MNRPRGRQILICPSRGLGVLPGACGRCLREEGEGGLGWRLAHPAVTGDEALLPPQGRASRIERWPISAYLLQCLPEGRLLNHSGQCQDLTFCLAANKALLRKSQENSPPTAKQRTDFHPQRVRPADGNSPEHPDHRRRPKDTQTRSWSKDMIALSIIYPRP
jgi:hypothetical protein